MSHFLKKYAKPIYILYGVFCFLFIIIACFYISPYARTAVIYTQASLENGNSVMTGNEALYDFCSQAGWNFSETYKILFNFNRKLQNVNNFMLSLGVVSLVMFALMMLCANASRKKYYISNLVSGVVAPFVNIVFTIVVFVMNTACIAPLNANFETLNWGNLANNTETVKSAIEWFKAGDESHLNMTATPLILYDVLMIIFVLFSVALIVYTVYRYKITQKELVHTEEGVDLNV